MVLQKERNAWNCDGDNIASSATIAYTTASRSTVRNRASGQFVLNKQNQTGWKRA
jgi:hypothetical protein